MKARRLKSQCVNCGKTVELRYSSSLDRSIWVHYSPIATRPPYVGCDLPNRGIDVQQQATPKDPQFRKPEFVLP